MKIKFFEKESDFIPRTYSIENAIEEDNENERFNDKFEKAYKHSNWICFIPLVLVVLFFPRPVEKLQFWFYFTLIIITVHACHELCHALFVKMSGRKIEKIVFFERFGMKLVSHVEPVFGAYNKTNSILFTGFPLIWLTLVPAILAVFVSPIRYWLLLVAAVNIATSYFDIARVLCVLRLPKNCLDFGDIRVTPKDTKKPIIIHRLSPSPEGDKIDHICYSYFDGELTEIEPYETEEVSLSRQTLIDHLNKQ